jgi:sugar porter (SP) family MFS transporter
LFQFNIVFGILVAFLSNALLADAGPNAWRWMLGVEAVPALVFVFGCLGLPESPRWLASRRQDPEAAAAVLAVIEPGTSMTEHRAKAALMAADGQTAASSGGLSLSVLREAKIPLLLAFLIAFFNQLSGINAVLYFAPRIFEMTGLGKQAALLQSVGIGVTNFVFTFVGLWLIDRLGRKTLLTIGSVGYVVSLGLVSWAFFTGRFSIVPVCVFAFIAAHAVGQGAVIWVFIAEIFPNHLRAAGQAFGCFTHWIFAALLTTFFPQMVQSFAPGWVFAFFAGMMVLQWIWVKTMVPETRGVPLEEIQRLLSRPGPGK